MNYLQLEIQGTIHSTKISGLRFKISWGQLDNDGFGGSRSISHVRRVSRSFKIVDVGSLLLVLELDDDFNFINDIV